MVLAKLYKQNREEYWNVLTHALGFLLAAISTILLLLKCEEGSTDFKFVSVIIFGFSSLLVYTISITFHLHWNKTLRQVYRALDHISIFYLIAGSYTPFLLINFTPDAGWRLLIIIWSIAFVGTIYKFFYTGKHEIFSLVLYIGMGWTGLIEYKTFIESIPSYTMTLIAIGGLLYLLGIIFFRAESMKYNHAIWHVFVVGANLFHFFAVYTIL